MIRLEIDDALLRPLVEKIVCQVLGQFGDGRLAYSEKEAAALLGLQPHQLRDRRLEGQVHATKIGREFRYRREDLLKLLERK